MGTFLYTSACTKGGVSQSPRYESLFENSLTAMMLIDLDSATIIDANPAACELYGYEREDMRGMPISEIETMDADEMQTHMREQREDSGEAGLILRHRRADGALRDLDVRAGPMPDVPGHVAYVIITDVTAREAAFRELDEHRTRLQDVLDERTRELKEARSSLSEDADS